MSKLRILIADDEPLARDRLRALLPRDDSVEIVGECASGPETVAAIRRERPDIAFLDLQMPGCDGLQAVNELSVEERPVIVFVTAHDQYAVGAFGVQAVDYVLKPFDRERLDTALKRAAENVRTRRAGDLGARIEGLLSEASAPAQPKVERLPLKTAGGIVVVRPGEIVWVEAADNYVLVHLLSRTLTVRETLSTLETRLASAHFARVSRSALVHLDQVAELQPTFHGDYIVVLRTGARLPLSRSLRGQWSSFLSGGATD